jgi:hypothetical protein
MSPRHFSSLNKSSKQLHKEQDDLANLFTSFTNAIGLSRYFSPSPDFTITNNPIVDPAEGGKEKTNHSNLYR